ncbi:MAG: aliphatic sulfonate ABC transporter substrate-binding protein, partial [Elusimicrobia bacterium]|nr:aliphatic sulfonate ABC transporter substrate-binding protein [Elusimicrobiota bacterium]
FSCKQKTSRNALRLGYFPNLTHAQALVGVQTGKFQENLKEFRFETKVFNAGPSAVEALFAGAIDMAYMGPIPAINAAVRSGGEFKIVAGAASGGAELVVREGANIREVKDFHGLRVATPQIGNSQDLSARQWFQSNGFKLKEKGGDLDLLPVANSDQITLFLKKDLDAAWTVPPWSSRLRLEAGGKKFLDESELWKPITGGDFSTAVLVVRNKFLKENPETVRKFVKIHLELTEWIGAHPEESKQNVNAQIKNLTGKPLSTDILVDSFAQVKFTVDPIRKSVLQQAKWAFDLGFLGREEPNLSGIFDLTLLNSILRERGLKEIQ